LDLNAYEILKNNTKRREGISDIPYKDFESIKADPGYGLPLLKSKTRQSSNFRNRHKDQVIEILTPKGELKCLPVASIALNNMNNTYSNFEKHTKIKVNSRYAAQ
jgi:hypothetical protein